MANAGVGEIGQFEQFNDVKTKEPSKPTLANVDINVVGVLYSELIYACLCHTSSNDGYLSCEAGNVPLQKEP